MGVRVSPRAPDSTGCGKARLIRLPWKQEIACSNHATLTITPLSFNGRTARSERANGGSIPSSGANLCMQWRNGNAVSCNLTTSGFDPRLHVHSCMIPKSGGRFSDKIMHHPECSRSSSGRARGFYPQGSGFESSREHHCLDVAQPEEPPPPKRQRGGSSPPVETTES